jgi:hypothetical protein
MDLFFSAAGFRLPNFDHATQMRRPRKPARKARIHTGEVRRPQYELGSLINEVRIAPRRAVWPPAGSSPNDRPNWAKSGSAPFALFDGNRPHDIVETCGARHQRRPERNPQQDWHDHFLLCGSVT